MAEGSLSRRMLLFGSALAAGGFNGRAAADEQSGIVKTKYTYKTAGCSIGADVHRKPGKQTLPVIVWIHGGAQRNKGPANACDGREDRRLCFGSFA